jgi:hypothetical protein
MPDEHRPPASRLSPQIKRSTGFAGPEPHQTRGLAVHAHATPHATPQSSLCTNTGSLAVIAQTSHGSCSNTVVCAAGWRGEGEAIRSTNAGAEVGGSRCGMWDEEERGGMLAAVLDMVSDVDKHQHRGGGGGHRVVPPPPPFKKKPQTVLLGQSNAALARLPAASYSWARGCSSHPVRCRSECH